MIIERNITLCSYQIIEKVIQSLEKEFLLISFMKFVIICYLHNIYL